MARQQLMTVKPWSWKFWLISIIATTGLSCSVTVIFIVYGLVSEALQPCGSLDAYLERSHCLRILQYSYYDSHIFDISFSPDGQLVAAAGLGGNPRVWSVHSGELLHELLSKASGAPEHIVISPNSQTIAFAQNFTYNTLTLADPKSGAILLQLTDILPVRDIAYSPDGATLAVISVADHHSTVNLRQVSDGQLLRSFPVDEGVDLRKVAFSPDGQKLLAVADSGAGYELYSWRMDNGVQVDKVFLAANNNLGIAFSPDRTIVALGSCARLGETDCAQAEVTLWQISDGRLLHRLSVPDAYVYDLAFSTDGSTLASSSGIDTIQLWRVWDGALLDTLEKHGRVYKIAFSPADKILAIGSDDVILWQIE